MEFGLDQLQTDLRPGSSRSVLSRHVEIARTCTNLVTDRFETKFHYAIWSQTGSKLVADLLPRARKLDYRPTSSSLQVCDQLRTFVRPNSVMEFGF